MRPKVVQLTIFMGKDFLVTSVQIFSKLDV